MDKGNCLAKFCREKIYSLSDWRKAMLAKRQELARQGIVNFEDNPEFTELTQCKGNVEDKFTDESTCAETNNNPYKPYSYSTHVNPDQNAYKDNGYNPYKRKKCPNGFRINPLPPFDCIPKKQATSKARAPSARAPSARSAKAPSPNAKTSRARAKRCPKGFNRSKKTGNCELKNR